MATKTAKDLPVGATIDGRSSLVWTKIGDSLWKDTDGELFNDAAMDCLLHSGGILTRVPVGRDAMRPTVGES